MTLEQWLQQKRFERPDLDLADWRSLIESALNLSKTAQRTHNKALSADEMAQLEALAKRFEQGEPLAYLIGTQAFLDFEVRVNAATLIPRADSETVALHAISLSKRFISPTVWDLGTGSGILAIAIKRAVPAANVVAVDFSAKALCIAEENAAQLGATIRFVESDWFTALEGERAHLIISNPPYLAPDDPHLPELRHEPQSALVVPNDGYADLFHLIDNAANHLFSGGFLLLEHGFEQADAVTKRFAQSPHWHDIHTLHDLANRPRATYACFQP